MRWLDHVIAAAPNFFASAQIFSNFSTSLATPLHFPRDGHVLRVGEPSRLNSVRNPKSEIKNCDGLPSRSLGADPLKHDSTRRLFVNAGVAPIFPFGRAPSEGWSRQSDSNQRPADYKPREESGVCHNFPGDYGIRPPFATFDNPRNRAIMAVFGSDWRATFSAVSAQTIASPTRTDKDLPFAKRAQSRWSAAQRAIPLRRTASDKITTRARTGFI